MSAYDLEDILLSDRDGGVGEGDFFFSSALNSEDRRRDLDLDRLYKFRGTSTGF